MCLHESWDVIAAELPATLRQAAVRYGATAVVAAGLTREEVEREARRTYGDAPVYIGLVPVPEQEIVFSGQLRIIGPAAPTE